MSLKSILMPVISRYLLSRERLEKLRTRTERERRNTGTRHQVHYFHQVDDPYSALVATSLPELLARYDIDLIAHVTEPPTAAATPARDQFIAYSRKDAQLLAARYGLDFHDTFVQPSPENTDRVARMLVAAIEDDRFTAIAGTLSGALWRGAASGRLPFSAADIRESDSTATADHLKASTELRRKLGHYLGATFFYGGEWYWGIDRLHHLETRLRQAGARRATSAFEPIFVPPADRQDLLPLLNPPPVDFYFSLRSPYSAIVAERVFALAGLTSAPVRLRFVLPMVMRGLTLPRAKKNYIVRDAAREAWVRGIPFGCLNDPVGRPAERGLALIPFAEREGKGQEYLLSFMRGVWAEGIDAGSDRGLRRIVERAGMSWDDAVLALRDESWRQAAEDNRAEMSGLGLWGVPSFRVHNTAVWGQDRLWAIEDALASQEKKKLAL